MPGIAHILGRCNDLETVGADVPQGHHGAAKRLAAVGDLKQVRLRVERRSPFSSMTARLPLATGPCRQTVEPAASGCGRAEDAVWAKLHALCDGARTASERLFETRHVLVVAGRPD
jgi:hypothetical protein